MEKLRICIIPEYPASLMTGGLQFQAEETCWALNTFGSGVQAELFNWSERRPLADVYHFIGFPSYLHGISRLLRQHGRPYVVTLLFGSTQKRLALWLVAVRQFANSQLLRVRDRYDAIVGAQTIVCLNEADAEAAHIIYGLEKKRIWVVPNGVKEEFFSATPDLWHQQFGRQPFVLCVGAIQARKGQLPLAIACNRLKLPLVLMGPVLLGQEAYAARVATAMKENAALGGRWIEHFSHEDPLRISAFAAAGLFVLLSKAETQPLSVLMAMAVRKPILLLRAPYTLAPSFSQLPCVTSTDLNVLCEAIKREWYYIRPTELPEEFTWPSVTRRLCSLYTRCTKSRIGVATP
jgi:glycosyltransferase involved in cell wall biosynthesis